MKEDEDLDYCKSCGGFVDRKNCTTLMVCPPIRQYYCKSCGDLCVTEREGVIKNVQSKD